LAQFAEVDRSGAVGRGRSGRLQRLPAPRVRLFDAAGIPEQRADLCPHGRRDGWRRHGGRRAQPHPGEAVRLAAQTALLGAGPRLAIAGVGAGRLGGERIPTGATDEQSLQERAGPLWSLPAPSAVLPQLFLHGGEEGGFHQGRTRNRAPFLGRAWLHTRGLARMFGSLRGWPQGQPPPGNATGTAVRCRALVGGILQHLTDRPAVLGGGCRCA
jgi:hypothetical protein